jgi:methionyl-tRNA formyltransferase
MDEGMDSGDIILQTPVAIKHNETYTSLYDKLADIGYHMIKDNLEYLFSNHVKRTVQNKADITFAKVISPEDEKLDFNKSCHEVDCYIRGLHSIPSSYALYDDLKIKVISATPSEIRSVSEPGTIISVSIKGIEVCTNDYDIFLYTVQIPGKKPTDVKNIINGNHIFKVNKSFK